ncbi:hypothetical protein [Mycolicibacterium monacense]|uniref:Uncharacterized protein n=4 Tax=Mycobacteriaceae TaxID=1762 RepID=A0AAD1J2G5_MYCMB|nr:hypothetical protein [Mycolicibacterium monacense]MDA4100078.1 hypothetical protein [Mycolicibacterium monacense DSM 44395]OBB76873.1 hypothetical protein A6B34_11575 [Mycolicibacterium monacense]OBF53401.1 hypothetical protein A5778_01080 [Mycolicibacterium monacense]ORB20273.1 hypothetical protein BST34_13070 [Mycolicibacterium monacense DSM 44395]QHP84380.1 hypothetical protein EWR22_02815 [Mycolicibacterium monacense DSM 44395]
MPLAAGVSQAAVGWLILLAAAAIAAGGVMLRAFIGRRADRHLLGRLTRRMRGTALARVLFGPVQHDALDPDELDQMILMPTIVVACGLCLTAVFLLGYRILT